MKSGYAKSNAAILTIGGRTQQSLRNTLAAAEFRSSGMLDQQMLVRRIRLLQSNRRITVSANMYVEDHESFGSNETVRRQQTNAAILSVQGVAQTVMAFEVRMGGEIRVEFVVAASLLDRVGNAMIDGEVKLFEGTSESTGDLDGVRQFQLYIPANASINHFVRVNNDDEGGDFATININITNVTA